ncbi:MAG: arginine N-succinyltransferase [Desulfobulbaceae bacterium]|nr:arginine N-succinyltransferase [Desulfobulbaceae bacterium]
MEHNQKPEQEKDKKTFSGQQVLGIIAGTIIVTLIITLVAAWFYFFPKPFEPVELSVAEQQQLELKLEQLADAGIQGEPRNGDENSADDGGDFTADGRLIPQKYSEDELSRTVVFTEREINALVAANTDLADKLAVDLDDNLISARLRVPVDPDFPFFGGKTLRVRAGVEMSFREGRPVVIVKGVSLMGVPLPNAWIGGIKNIDLVEEYGTGHGFWKAFADGVESISVGKSRFTIVLKE